MIMYNVTTMERSLAASGVIKSLRELRESLSRDTKMILLYCVLTYGHTRIPTHSNPRSPKNTDKLELGSKKRKNRTQKKEEYFSILIKKGVSLHPKI